MRILRTYVLKEHLGPLGATLGALTAVLLLGHIIKFAELVIAKGVSIIDIIRLLIYLIPYMLTFTVPMACLIAMVMAFSRLSSDYELIAMRASGVAPLKLVYPVLVAGIILSGLMLVLNDRVVPEARLAFRRQLKAIGIRQPTAYIEAGTFIREFPPYTLFVYQIEDEKLFDVRIYEPQPDGPTRTIIARSGEVIPLKDRRTVRLMLYDGSMDQWDPARPGTFYKITFGNYSMDLRADQEDPSHIAKKLKEMTMLELLAERRQLLAQGVDVVPVELEFHRKIASSFAVFVFIVFGLSLGLRLQHHERLISFVWILGIFLSYYLLIIAMNAIAIKGWVPPWATMWAPNLLGLGDLPVDLPHHGHVHLDRLQRLEQPTPGGITLGEP